MKFFYLPFIPFLRRRG